MSLYLDAIRYVLENNTFQPPLLLDDDFDSAAVTADERFEGLKLVFTSIDENRFWAARHAIDAAGLDTTFKRFMANEDIDEILSTLEVLGQESNVPRGLRTYESYHERSRRQRKIKRLKNTVMQQLLVPANKLLDEACRIARKTASMRPDHSRSVEI